jgi:hypothetical protein
MSTDRNAGREASLFVTRTPDEIEQDNPKPRLDISGFQPKSIRERRPDTELARLNAERTGHHSELAPVNRNESARTTPPPPAPKKAEAKPLPPKQMPRRFRTNRNAQVNIKASDEARARFYKLCDERDQASGIVLEYLLELHDRFGANASGT